MVFHVFTTKQTARQTNIIQGGVTLFNVTPTIVPNRIKGIRINAIFRSTAITFLYGFLFLSPIKNEVTAPVKIINFEIGIASCVLKLSNISKIGIRRPPPPIPPAFDNAEPITIKNPPMISLNVGGKKSL